MGLFTLWRVRHLITCWTVDTDRGRWLCVCVSVWMTHLCLAKTLGVWLSCLFFSSLWPVNVWSARTTLSSGLQEGVCVSVSVSAAWVVCEAHKLEIRPNSSERGAQRFYFTRRHAGLCCGAAAAELCKYKCWFLSVRIKLMDSGWWSREADFV